jgi:hypothetical protein
LTPWQEAASLSLSSYLLSKGFVYIILVLKNSKVNTKHHANSMDPGYFSRLMIMPKREKFRDGTT